MDLIRRLEVMSACQISDGMGAVGLPREGLFGIYAMEPSRHMVGRAFTVVFRPASEAEHLKIEYISDVKTGDALVLGNHGNLDSSVWGGQRTVGALQRGAVGTVVDGAYRDVEEHRRMQYPVFGRAATIVGSAGYHVPVAVDEVLSIGGITITPGDYVVGDASGVIVIPEGHAIDVVDEAERITAEEDRISRAVEAGTDFASFRAAVREGKA